MDRCDTLRATLIERVPEDHRQAIWLVDRAVHALGTLSLTDADVSVLVGVPTPEQRASVQAAARAALELLDRARQSAQAAVANLENQLMSAPPGSEQSQSADARIARLVDVEQSQRIPLYSALSHALLAGCERDEKAKSASAAAAVRSLDALRVRSQAMEAARDTVSAIAVLNASHSMTPKALSAISAKLSSVQQRAGAEPATKARARLGLIAAGAAIEPLPASEPWSRRLIETEARVRAMLSTDSAGSPRRVTDLTGPVLALVNLASEPAFASELSPGVTLDQARDARRAMVYAKVASVVDPAAPMPAVHAELLLARAVTLLRDTSNPKSQREAEPILSHVAGRIDAPSDIRADALWELAALQDRSGGGGGSSTATLSRLLREFPLSARSISAARTLAERLAPDYSAFGTPTTPAPTSSPPSAPIISDDYLLAIQHLASLPGHERFSADLIRARLLASPGRVSPQALREAIQTYAKLPPGPGKAGALVAIARSIPLAAASINTLPPSDRSALIADTLAFLRASAPEHVPEASLVFAEGIERESPAQAIDLYTAALNSDIDHPATQEAARIRLGLARAFRSVGKHELAVEPLQHVAAMFDKPPGIVDRDPAYWQAWCELLELSVLNDQSESRLAELRAHLARLELIDSALGGKPLAPRFAKLKALCTGK